MDIDKMLTQLRQLLAFKNRVEAILPDLEVLIASGKQTSEDFTKVLGELDPQPSGNVPIAGSQDAGGASNPSPAPDVPETSDPSAQGSA